MPEEFRDNIPPEFREGEKKVETEVILDFMRHGKKEIDPNKPDNEIRLSKEGRKMADKKGKRINSSAEASIALGSLRKRTQETAARAMLVNMDEISENASLEEIKGMINNKFQNEQMLDPNYDFGIKSKKIIEDKRLDYNANGPVAVEIDEAAGRGEYFKYLTENSDKRAIELGDKDSSTYLRYAGNVAEIVNHYCRIGKNFNKLVSKSNGNEEYGNRIERYLGSHQGVTENFILMVLEKTGGKEKRNELATKLGDGFKETQGFRVEIINNGDEQKIRLTYGLPEENNDGKTKEETIEFDKSFLEEIIKKRDRFEEKVAANNAKILKE